MKVFEFAGIIFNADNVCTVQKVTIKNEESKEIPAFQIVTVSGGMNFTFETAEERDKKFTELLEGMRRL
jgi:hypothetical protein